MNTGFLSEEKREKSMAKGAFSLAASVLLVKIIGFIYKVPLSHILGDEGMGYFNSAYTIFSFFYMLCSGGVPRAVSIMVTKAHTMDEECDANTILSVALKFFVVVGFIFTAIFLLFSPLLADVIGNSLATMSLICIAPSLTFVAASGVLKGFLNGKGKLGSIAVSEVIDSCIKFIVGLSFAMLAVRLGYDAPMISAFTIVGVTLGSFVASLFLYISTKIDISKEKIRQKTKISAKWIIKEIFKISVPITISSAIMGISNIVDLGMIIKRLVAAGMSAERAISLYGNFTTLAVPMLNLVMALITPLSAAALPHLTKAHVLNNRIGFSDFTEKVLKICASLSLPLTFAFVFYSEQILVLLFDDVSAQTAAPLLTLLAPSVFFMSMLTVTNTVLESSLHTKAPLIAMSVGSVFKFLISYILIANPEIGICGAPIGTSIYYAISFLISASLMLVFSGVRASSFLSLCRPFAASFLSVFISKIIYSAILPRSNPNTCFLICVIISIAIYLLLFCVFMQKEAKKILYFVKINKNRSV